MSPESPHTPVVKLTDQERVVLKEAIRQYLDEPRIGTPISDEKVEEILEQHLQAALDDGTIRVESGMKDLYQSVFQSYGSALKEAVDEEAEDAESMADFFEGAFKSILDKIEDATHQGPMM